MSTAALERTYIDMEPGLRKQAEDVFNVIGLSFSQAVNLFTRQAVLRRAFPVELNASMNKPLCIDDMTDEDFDAMVQESFRAVNEGRTYTPDEARKILEAEHEEL